MTRIRPYRSPTLIWEEPREHLRACRVEDPGVPVQQLLREIRELGYQGIASLPTRYLSQGRAEDDRAHLSPRRAAGLLLSAPDKLTAGQQEHLGQIAVACPEITALHGLAGAIAALLKPSEAHAAGLERWIHAARTEDLPHLYSFARGLEQDRDAVVALTTPHHNGRTEGVNTRTKMLKRQMYGRAGFTLLRHRILLA